MSNPELELTGTFPAPSIEVWRQLVEKALKGADFDKRLVARTADGIRVEPLYVTGGAPPAVQPIPQAPRSAAAPWQMRQLTCEPEPEAANTALREDSAAGATGVVLAVEAPGQPGLPATVGAFATALAGVRLAQTTVVLAAGDAAAAAADALETVWSMHGIAAADRSAALNIDPIGTLARLGGGPRAAADAIAAAAGVCAEPRWRQGRVAVLLADGRPVHEAGGSEAQELGVMLASLIAYLRAAEAAGLGPADSLPRIEAALATDTDLFLSIAKLRAARLLVRRVAEAAGVPEAAGRCRIAVTTSQRMMTRRDPWVNLLRTCTAAMSAAIGGADGITILPFCWPLGRPDAFARRIARNMHVVLAEESGLGRVADPAAGGWHLEALTRELADKAWSQMQAIEAAGGVVAALRSGMLADRIGSVAAERAKALATGRTALTGTSAYPLLGEDTVRVAPHLPARLPIGTTEQVAALAPRRLAEPFEALRDRAEAAAARTGKPARVFLASIGTLAEHAQRTTWITNLLAVGGITTAGGEGYASSAEAGRAFAESGTDVACICGSDEGYELLAEAVAGVLRQAGARKVLLAGRPRDEAALRAAGVDGFLFSGQDMLAALAALQADLGIA